MRRESKIDETQYKTYQDLVLLPFVEGMRRRFNNWDGDPGTITLQMRVVSNQDGDFAQVATIINNPKWYKKREIVCNKHNPNRMGVKQAADNADVFKKVQKVSES